eukprot:1196699-Pyramimonas_sp.AAC.1
MVSDWSGGGYILTADQPDAGHAGIFYILTTDSSDAGHVGIYSHEGGGGALRGGSQTAGQCQPGV